MFFFYIKENLKVYNIIKEKRQDKVEDPVLKELLRNRELINVMEASKMISKDIKLQTFKDVFYNFKYETLSCINSLRLGNSWS